MPWSSSINALITIFTQYWSGALATALVTTGAGCAGAGDKCLLAREAQDHQQG
jgi:hypothetical protein